jgi:hypothetical protein
MSTIFAGGGALAPNPAPFSLSNRLAATLRKRDVHYKIRHPSACRREPARPKRIVVIVGVKAE